MFGARWIETQALDAADGLTTLTTSIDGLAVACTSTLAWKATTSGGQAGCGERAEKKIRTHSGHWAVVFLIALTATLVEIGVPALEHRLLLAT